MAWQAQRCKPWLAKMARPAPKLSGSSQAHGKSNPNGPFPDPAGASPPPLERIGAMADPPGWSLSAGPPQGPGRREGRTWQGAPPPGDQPVGRLQLAAEALDSDRASPGQRSRWPGRPGAHVSMVSGPLVAARDRERAEALKPLIVGRQANTMRRMAETSSRAWLPGANRPFRAPARHD